MHERWGAALRIDPGANPIWHPATLPFRLISPPSPERLWRHIRLCASENPWLPEVRPEPDAAGSGAVSHTALPEPINEPTDGAAKRLSPERTGRAAPRKEEE